LEQDYGCEYRALYEGHWWWRAREEAVVKTIRSLRLPPSAEILDVGCGDALFFSQLSAMGNVEGLESEAALVSDENRRRHKIYLQPFDKNFQPHKKYNLILMLDVLEHLDNPAEALDCARELLTEKGILLITVPAFRALWTNHDVINHHRTRYRKTTLIPLLLRSHLNVILAQYLFQWTFPAKLAVRVYEKLVSPSPEVPKVPPAPVNSALYHLSKLEQISVGRFLPFGTSLLVVSRRGDV
jgi:2-polyprenyl-3-methyl-5-hydroxy-6-metoxy-1,4-benzoquinol methylase